MTNFSFLLLVLLAVVACKEVQTVSITKAGTNIVVDLSTIQKKYPADNLIIRSLEITKKNCTDQCQMWIIEGNEKSQAVVQVIYGAVPNGMREVVVHRELRQGEYSLSGNLWLIDDKVIDGPVTIIGDFVIH